MKYKKWLTFLFIIYLMLIMYMLLFATAFGRNLEISQLLQSVDKNQFNIIPFKTVQQYFRYYNIFGPVNFFINIFGNILVFIPFGSFYYILCQKRSFVFFIFFSILLVYSVEMTQVMFQVGRFDIDDIILNVFGASIGYVVARIFIKRQRGKRNE